MRSPRPSRFVLAVIVALAGVLVVPAASSAIAKGTKGKLWAVSLSGSAATDETATTSNVSSNYGPGSAYPQPPDGCIANTTATYRLHAAARISPKPTPTDLSPGLGIDVLDTPVLLSSLDAGASDEIDGSWVVDPNYSPPGSFSRQPVDPSVCAGFTPIKVAQRCTFQNGRTNTSLHLSLSFPGRRSNAFLFLYDDSATGDGYTPSPVRCPDGTAAATLGSEFGDLPFLNRDLHTSLPTRAVLGLRRGARVSASGTIVMPEYSFASFLGVDKPDGNETLTYNLKVKRVR